jgi:hypothetical protein
VIVRGRHVIKGLQIAVDGCTAGCQTGTISSEVARDRTKLARAAEEAVGKGVRLPSPLCLCERVCVCVCVYACVCVCVCV